jgi:hypothetical protein
MRKQEINDQMIAVARAAAESHGGTFQHDRGVSAFGWPTIGVFNAHGRRCATVCVDANGQNPQVRTVQNADGTPVE